MSLKINPPVCTTQQGIKEIENNSLVYMTQEGKEEIKNNPSVNTTRKKERGD